jgi:hypothetical protein
MRNKETLPFTIPSKRIKYVGIKLTKKVKTCTLKINEKNHWWVARLYVLKT